MIDISISDWRLIAITLDETGPFQNGLQTFSFMGDTAAEEAPTDVPGPSSFYMLLAENGHGKTTILESIHGLFGLLSNPPAGRFVDWRAPGRVQLDIRATWTIDGQSATVLLSVWTGSERPLVEWSDERVEEEAQASAWAKLGILRGPGNITGYDASNELGFALFRAIKESAGHLPGALFGGHELPTVLLFPADRFLNSPPEQRSVEAPHNWVYQPAHCFGSEGDVWNGSIDNLLVWLAWLDDGQLEELLEFVNERIFAGEDKTLRAPRRQELLAYVSTKAGDHPLNALSHGERALLQLYVRTAAHMTRNTIILIDEVEIHLHTRWMNRMFQTLKAMLQSRPTLSIVFTTHDRELIKVFDHKRSEPGIVKGGYLIPEGME